MFEKAVCASPLSPLELSSSFFQAPLQLQAAKCGRANVKVALQPDALKKRAGIKWQRDPGMRLYGALHGSDLGLSDHIHQVLHPARCDGHVQLDRLAAVPGVPGYRAGCLHFRLLETGGCRLQHNVSVRRIHVRLVGSIQVQRVAAMGDPEIGHIDDAVGFELSKSPV